MRRKDTEEELWGKKEVWLYFTPTTTEALALFLPFSTKPKQPPGTKGFDRPLEEEKPSPVFYFNTIRKEWWKLCPQMRKTFTNRAILSAAKIHPFNEKNPSFFLQGMAIKFSEAALHSAQHNITAKFHPFLCFVGCRGLVKQSPDGREAREGHAARKLL